MSGRHSIIIQFVCSDEELWRQIKRPETKKRFAFDEALRRIISWESNQDLGADINQKFPVEVSFVPMFAPSGNGKIILAEEARFSELLDFLEIEFYRGLAIGNAPRRCYNCRKYFLLTSGYNTCYCNNIAPGETVRTCRKVGAHRKEAQGREEHTPV